MIIALRKPRGPTSHDVVALVRRLCGEAKVGHGGTLDPFAEGVLVVAVGQASTRKLGEILEGTSKTYEALIKLGETSTTDDPEGKLTEVTPTDVVAMIERETIEKALAGFRGNITQKPPAHSAVRVRGIRAYKLARQGQKLTMPPRQVEVQILILLDWHPPYLKIRATVSSGTYVRSLARDIGAALGVGGYLKELRRTAVGPYTLANSIDLETLKKHPEMLKIKTA